MIERIVDRILIVAAVWMTVFGIWPLADPAHLDWSLLTVADWWAHATGILLLIGAWRSHRAASQLPDLEEWAAQLRADLESQLRDAARYPYHDRRGDPGRLDYPDAIDTTIAEEPHDPSRQ